MSNDNHQQSVGGEGAIDGISGSDNRGTEGADSGQGVNQGKNKETDANRPGRADDGQHRGGKSDRHVGSRGPNVAGISAISQNLGTRLRGYDGHAKLNLAAFA